MNKKAICKKISKELYEDSNYKVNIDQVTINKILNMFFKEVSNAMIEDRKLEFRKFGVFKPIVQMAKVGRCPKSPKITIKIPAQKKIKFKTSKILLKQMNK